MKFRVRQVCIIVVLLTTLLYLLHMYVTSGRYFRFSYLPNSTPTLFNRSTEIAGKMEVRHATNTVQLYNDSSKPIQNNVKLFRMTDNGWISDFETGRSVSNMTAKMIQTSLRTPMGMTPIFIHNPKVDIYVSGSIKRNGGWELDIMHLIHNLVKTERCSHFIDIGANLGVFALALGKTGIHVTAIEPLSINIHRLYASVQAGHLANDVTIVHTALGNNTGQNITLGKATNNIGGTFVNNEVNTNKLKEARSGVYNDLVTMATMNDLLDLPGWNMSRKKTVIKIDVEGYEAKVLMGADRFFKMVDVRAVLMEWMFQKTGTDSERIKTFMKYQGFVAHNLTMSNRAPLPVNSSHRWPTNILWRK